ncbi:DNA-binding response regulator [Seongchinamella sediminis]|uniref:DNA-binding response regulator n=1 Tax=Seongchinamella sediminis TaxID=2283635 RepID=A0A3L7DXG3_9GAMM|nr:response regulator transcription factor [Seongchinamella sediminis]RLQ20953.1 DNA-binding response regulator [Seongchinamella sediminis]
MEHLFISTAGKLRERWQQAFPRASAAVDVEEIGPVISGPRGIVWLDIAALASGERPAQVRAATALGWPVVVMAATPGESEAFQLLNQGAMGYCHVKAAPQQLREIALVVEHGGLWMPPELMQRFLALSARVVPTRAPVEPELNELTSRELMVAEQVARGASNREIAGTLDISERTVKAHLSAIFEKLGVRDRVQLALAMNNIPTYSTVN